MKSGPKAIIRETTMETNKIELLSVGIDIGSSTSHLVFSRLILIRDEMSPSRRFEIKGRDIIYEGEIIETPLLDDRTVNIDKLTDFFNKECRHAGIDFDDVDTGAVIITGETAKKQNAPQLVEGLSKDSGKFVAATAGPNFESVLAAMGSGATARSKEQRKTILSCDIGGGTSNLAIAKDGKVVSTSCISVGGRLISLDAEGRISGLAKPVVKVMRHLGLDYKIGHRIPKADIETIASRLAESLIEVMNGPATSMLSRELMVTDGLNYRDSIDEYLFSGGVAEFIYGASNSYDDIGKTLAEKIVSLSSRLKAPVVEPRNKIRATVIGAGVYSLSISGSSGFMDDKLMFPIRNVPVLRVDVEQSHLSEDHVTSQINAAFQRYDLMEGQEIVALYFKDPLKVNYPELELFAKSIETALPNSIVKKIPVILIFEKDVACSVGNVIRRETYLKTNLLSLDELSLEDGDWIDIGEPLVGSQVFPVTVKSLVFPVD
jgi:ethanolamine utilization protein EutA